MNVDGENVTKSAMRHRLAACPHCRFLVDWSSTDPAAVSHCPRCGGAIHQRVPRSLERSWAWLLCAAICYVPANFLPILTVIQFGRGAPDTILSGVVHLFAAGQWPIAVLVFVASVFVPLVKIMVIAFLLITVHLRSNWRTRERTALYHIVEALGRWSMIDIFMISILVALVQLGSLATVEAGLGAAFFGVVVVSTMFAASVFDPRLLWDEKIDAQTAANK